MARSIEDRLVDTFLPLYFWEAQKVFGPFMSKEEWHCFWLIFVPAPKSIANRLCRELAHLASPALQSPSKRRKKRADYKNWFRHEARNCGDDGKRMHAAVLNWMREWRKSLEAKGYRLDWTRVRKIRDIEAETDSLYNQLATQPDLPEVFGPVSQGRAQEIVNLFWEIAVYGQYDDKPWPTRNSPFWAILGLDPMQLEEAMESEEGLLLLLDAFLALPQRYDSLPEERQLQAMKWVIKTRLPHEYSSVTTAEALNKAIDAGLVHKAIKVRDGETGQVVRIDIEDKSAVNPEDLPTKKLSHDDIIELFKSEGINKSDLTEKDWRIIFRVNDAIISEGAEIGSKKGISLNAYFGTESAAARKQLSRMRERIRTIQARKKQSKGHHQD